VEELAPGLVPPLIGVRTEVVALGLDQVGRQALAAEAVVESQGRRVGGHRHPGRHRGRHHPPHGRVGGAHGLGEEVGQQQVGQKRKVQ